MGRAIDRVLATVTSPPARAANKGLCILMGVLLVVAGLGYSWLFFSVAKEDFAFFLPATLWLILFTSVVTLWLPVLLGAATGLLAASYLYGASVAKQMFHGIRLKSLFYLVPAFILLSTLVEFLVSTVGVHGQILLSPLSGPIIGEKLTYTGEYLSISAALAYVIAAFVLAVSSGYFLRKQQAKIGD